jgi:hypothetical protein
MRRKMAAPRFADYWPGILLIKPTLTQSIRVVITGNNREFLQIQLTDNSVGIDHGRITGGDPQFSGRFKKEMCVTTYPAEKVKAEYEKRSTLVGIEAERDRAHETSCYDYSGPYRVTSVLYFGYDLTPYSGSAEKVLQRLSQARKTNEPFSVHNAKIRVCP